jgi:hypothetical protein
MRVEGGAGVGKKRGENLAIFIFSSFVLSLETHLPFTKIRLICACGMAIKIRAKGNVDENRKLDWSETEMNLWGEVSSTWLRELF